MSNKQPAKKAIIRTKRKYTKRIKTTRVVTTTDGYYEKDELNLTKDVLEIIQKKSPIEFDVLRDVIMHIAKTFDDKYQQPGLEWIQTKGLLLSENGKFANLHSALKYCQRYLSKGSEKSFNPVDLLKAIHYLCFELCSRKNQENGREQKNN